MCGRYEKARLSSKGSITVLKEDLEVLLEHSKEDINFILEDVCVYTQCLVVVIPTNSGSWKKLTVQSWTLSACRLKGLFFSEFLYLLMHIEQAGS